MQYRLLQLAIPYPLLVNEGMSLKNLSVSLRIIGGYIVVVILVAAIAMSGIFGINSISTSFDEVTQEAMPMVDNSNLLVTHTLLAQRKLNAFEKSTNNSELATLASEFNKLIDNNRNVANSLTTLVSKSPNLKQLFTQAEQAQKNFVSAGQDLMRLHKEYVAKQAIVSSERALFGDMGDETISFVYDLEGAVESDATAEDLSELETYVENITNSVNDAVRSGIKPAVLEARSDLSVGFQDMEALINKLQSSSELRGNEAFVGLNDAYQRQKVSANNILNAYMEQLDAQQQVKSSFAAAEEATNQTVDSLANLVNGVDASTIEIKQNTQTVITNSRTSLLVFALIALLASMVTAFFITRSIRTPLNETVETIKKVATGDLTQEFTIDRSDELGQLSASMQDLVTQLRDMLASVSSNSEQLASTAEQSTAICNLTFNNVTQQKEQTDMMVTSIHEMTATVNEVSTSAGETLTEVELAYGEATGGEEVLNENIKRFKFLAEDIQNGADVIQKLNDDCKNIGGVLDVIKGVAEQTNLLALNAAIEAARAGEQGRGFAVVADEVRTLASRAHDSTSEIEEMISRLQTRAQDAVSVMDKSRKEAQHSVESISEAGTALQKVSEAISIIKDKSYQIASASEEQAAASQSQLENITAIANAAEETASGAQENQSASQELAKMAEVQRGLVNQFVI